MKPLLFSPLNKRDHDRATTIDDSLNANGHAACRHAAALHRKVVRVARTRWLWPRCQAADAGFVGRIWRHGLRHDWAARLWSQSLGKLESRAGVLGYVRAMISVTESSNML